MAIGKKKATSERTKENMLTVVPTDRHANVVVSKKASLFKT